MKFHGNYCGPNWSAGEHQPSVISSVPAVDEFDETCRQHDAVYALGGDTKSADYDFFHQNFGKGVSRTIAATVVGAQGLLKPGIKFETNFNMSKTSNLRGSKATKQPKQEATDSGMHLVGIPAAMGTTIKGRRSLTKRKTGDTLLMEARVCVGRPAAATQVSVPEMNGVIILNPVNLGNDEIQNMTRVYQRYRFLHAQLHYRPVVATSSSGEVFVVSNQDPNYKPVDNSINASFYQRALSTEHAMITPIWNATTIDLDLDQGWKVCDNLNSTSLEEFCSGVVYTYTDGSIAVPGYYVIDVEVEFSGLRFNPRNLLSGSRQGYGTRASLSFTNPTLNADAIAVGSLYTPGDIYLCILSTLSSTFGAGTASTLLAISSGASGTQPFTVDGATAVYARAISTSQLALFTTYDAAVGYDIADKLLYGVTATGTTTLPASIQVQLRNSTQPNL